MVMALTQPLHWGSGKLSLQAKSNMTSFIYGKDEIRPHLLIYILLAAAFCRTTAE